MLVVGGILMGCAKSDPFIEVPISESSGPQPYFLKVPDHFPEPLIPDDKPMTVQGVELGRKLFYDPILSGDFTQSCASCHNQKFAFTDNELRVSVGIDGIEGDRNSMAIINLAWGARFLWDGRSATLEEQALEPVPNPIEMHLEWTEAVERLKNDADYPDLFDGAFPGQSITRTLAANAMAQFMRSIVSGNSRYDAYVKREGWARITPDEILGEQIINSEVGDCFHCHGSILLTDNEFHNNGLDSNVTNTGVGEFFSTPSQYGWFKTPTLRNVELTAPYMHDGRFKTLEEVVEHYSTGVKWSDTIDPLMKQATQGGLQLEEDQKRQLVAFLKTLTDEDFINNPAYSDPNSK
ncbi:MAG: cytochrome-c peroxidase [Salibacteraceae bacterium]